MELKLPILFLFIISSLISSSQVQAFTVCDLISNQNITASEIQQAVDNGSIQYSDLPGSFQVNIHAQGETISQPTKAITDNSMPCQQSKPDNSWIGIVIVISILIVPFIVLSATGYISFLSLFPRPERNYKINPNMNRGTLPKGFSYTDEQNETRKQKSIHPPHAKFLLALKIIRVKKDNA